MASETSELTFVRCPSCRSLVPASASRCRICNSILEGGGKASDGDGARSGGRVRQRTISANAEDLLAAADQSAVDAPSAPPVVEPPAKATDQEMEVDPLSAFLEEIELEEPAPKAAAPQAVSSIPAAEEHADDLDALFGEIEHEVVATPEPTPPEPSVVPAAPAAEAYDAAGDDLDDFMSTLESELDGELANVPFSAPPLRDPAPVEPPPPPPPPPAPERARSEAKSAPQAKPQQQQPQRQASQENRAREQRPSHSGGDRRDNARGDHNRHERRGEENRKAGHQQGQRNQEKQHERHNERPQTHASGPKTGRMRPGRLFGWLVSFESPDGRAIELREGKFFVTATSIRGTDLVVEDPSISTPHALMSVSADNGLMIQDLMSDRGIFVRSGDRGQYQREDGPIEVRHGDWVRFGDVEFLVTVVPSGK